jgi:adenylosuccinate synthase
LGLPEDALGDWTSDRMFDRFVADCEALFASITLALPVQLPGTYWILEGAQGLALDEDLGAFPFVTRSKTGLPWALEFLNQLPAPDIQATVYYLTRAYGTRHGAGPFPHEGPWVPPLFSDPTNQPNAYQGTLRLAPLDVQALSARIVADQARSALLAGKVRCCFSLSVSCLDHLDATVPVAEGRKVPVGMFATWLADRLELATVGQSWGPTRETYRFPDSIQGTAKVA